MGRTFRKERTWDDNNRSSKNKLKNIGARSIQALNTDVEEEFEGWDDIYSDDRTEAYTTKQYTKQNTT
jgi:hypothetical protein